MCVSALLRGARLRAGGLLGAAILIATSAGAQTITRDPFIQNPDALTSTMTIELRLHALGEHAPLPLTASAVDSRTPFA
jgi:hypothetical protein